MRIINRISKLFQPVNIIPKNAEIKYQDITSTSQKLMLNLGIIRAANPGCFYLLPLGLRSLEKIVRLVDEEMQNIGAQKIELPYLTTASLWKKTGRLESVEKELFLLKDRYDKQYVLGPTYEESVTDLLSSVSPLSYRQLPLYLYQITSKFRDEMKPRFGFLRSRQFLMKDLYTFDTSIEKAEVTYNLVGTAYEKIFTKLGVHFRKVTGETGNIGGLISHEYHLLSNIGEDKLALCTNCGYASNCELLSNSSSCPECNSNDNLTLQLGIEVGHTFLLGDKYSLPLNATYLTKEGKPSVIQMGCYGLGLSRLLAASLEVLSKENEIRWPFIIAPYKVVIIPPKEGSKEEQLTSNLSENIYHELNSISEMKNDILFDDRNKFTIGKRIYEAKRMGYPYIIVIGEHSVEIDPKYELYDLVTDTHHILTSNEIINYIKSACNT